MSSPNCTLQSPRRRAKVLAMRTMMRMMKTAMKMKKPVRKVRKMKRRVKRRLRKPAQMKTVTVVLTQRTPNPLRKRKVGTRLSFHLH